MRDYTLKELRQIQEAFENMHPKHVENIVSKQQRETIVNGLEEGANPSVLLGSKDLIEKIVSKDILKLYDDYALIAYDYDKSPKFIKFSLYALTFRNMGEKECEGVRNVIYDTMKRNFGDKFVHLAYGCVGGNDCRGEFYLTDEKTIKAIHDKFKPHLVQGELF